MKRAFLILLAAASVASAQTYLTVTADTNRVIRTNFSMAIGGVTGLQAALDGKLGTNSSLAISNVTGLQTTLDAKLATNGDAAGLTNLPASLLRTNGSASGLTNFPAIVLQTNSSLSAFPAGLLRTNGDGSGLTNLPNANLSNAIGVLPVSNGGTGSTNASNARTALGLQSAATNPASAFQPASSALTNLAAGDASGLTNLPNANLGTATGVLGIANGGSGATNAGAARTNFSLVWSGLTNVDAAGFRTALSLGTAATNDASAFQPASANLTNLANNNGGSLTNISVDLTAVLPSYSNNAGKVLAVATGATNVEWTALSNTVTDASTLTNFPASILQTNSADGSFPAFLLRTNGSAAGLTSFPAIVLQTNSSESVFPQALLRTNGDGSGLTNLTAASVIGTVSLATNVTGTVAIANGGTGATTASNARVNLLPSYTGNSNRILALNSNATDLVWAVDAGGGAVDLSTTNATGILPITKGGTGTNSAAGARAALIVIEDGGVALGSGATAGAGGSFRGAIVGKDATNNTYGGAALGQRALVSGNLLYGGGAVGHLASSTDGGGGVGYDADTAGGGAVGHGADSSYGFAGGYFAVASTTNASQIGTGTNTNNNTIQFLSAGTVDTNEWSALANSTTFGHYLMAAPTNGTNGQILALNSNATAVVWTNDGGGTPNLTNVTGVLAISNGGTGANTISLALTNLGIYTDDSGFTAITIGPEQTMTGSLSAVAIGHAASVSNSDHSIAIGRLASSPSGSKNIAIGFSAQTTNIVNAVQIGEGVNTTSTTIQFRNAGTVNETEWSYLANASTRGGYAMTNTAGISGTKTFVAYDGTNYSTNSVTISNGIITGWTQ